MVNMVRRHCMTQAADSDRRVDTRHPPPAALVAGMTQYGSIRFNTGIGRTATKGIRKPFNQFAKRIVSGTQSGRSAPRLNGRVQHPLFDSLFAAQTMPQSIDPSNRSVSGPKVDNQDTNHGRGKGGQTDHQTN